MTPITHNIIVLDKFNVESEDRIGIKLPKFEIIIGHDSNSIFEYYETETIAGLQKSDCTEFLESVLYNEVNDAFIAGLTNWNEDGEIFVFFNRQRMMDKEMCKRLIVHESLHLAVALISEYEYMKSNGGKFELIYPNDDNIEFFAETMERLCIEIEKFIMDRMLYIK